MLRANYLILKFNRAFRNYDIMENLKQNPLSIIDSKTKFLSQLKLLSYEDVTLVGEKLLV